MKSSWSQISGSTLMITEVDFLDELTDDEGPVGHVEGGQAEDKGGTVTDFSSLPVGIMWLWCSRLN